MPAGDKRKVDRIDINTNPVGVVYADNTPLVPITYGGSIKLKSTATIDIIPHTDTNEIELVVNQAGLALPSNDAIEAMTGTYGTPSTDNRFVTDEDPRMSDSRTPEQHLHPVEDVSGLQDVLNTKANSQHAHTAD
jgi:hypothetical protein